MRTEVILVCPSLCSQTTETNILQIAKCTPPSQWPRSQHHESHCHRLHQCDQILYLILQCLLLPHRHNTTTPKPISNDSRIPQQALRCTIRPRSTTHQATTLLSSSMPHHPMSVRFPTRLPQLWSPSVSPRHLLLTHGNTTTIPPQTPKLRSHKAKIAIFAQPAVKHFPDQAVYGYIATVILVKNHSSAPIMAAERPLV